MMTVEEKSLRTGTTETEKGSRSEEQFKDETQFKFMNKADVPATVHIDKSGKYYIQDSGSGMSWLIGTDDFVYSSDYDSKFANGFVEGINGCPPDLEIPGILTDSEGNTKPVEIIGRGAFYQCGCNASCSRNKGMTKRLKVPRQVKVIKTFGLGYMQDLESFEIEAGSELQTIEDLGLDRIGYTTGQTPSKRNGTLILPSTLSSVGYKGINWCNLFHTIIYCGSHFFINKSYLEHDVSPDTVVRVTCRYPSSPGIFYRSPNRTAESEAEAERMCQGYFTGPTPNPACQRGCTPLLAKTHHLLSFFSPLLPTDILPSLSLKNRGPLVSFFIPFG